MTHLTILFCQSVYKHFTEGHSDLLSKVLLGNVRASRCFLNQFWYTEPEVAVMLTFPECSGRSCHVPETHTSQLVLSGHHPDMLRRKKCRFRLHATHKDMVAMAR